jgi:hypothetical protein
MHLYMQLTMFSYMPLICYHKLTGIHLDISVLVQIKKKYLGLKNILILIEVPDLT